MTKILLLAMAITASYYVHDFRSFLGALMVYAFLDWIAEHSH